MNGFELDVGKSSANERWQADVVGVQKPFECIKTIIKVVWWRRDEQGVARSGAPNPILRTPEFARLFRNTAPGSKDDLVHLADKPERKWEAITDAGDTMLDRSNIVGYFGDIVEFDRRCLVILKEQKV